MRTEEVSSCWYKHIISRQHSEAMALPHVHTTRVQLDSEARSGPSLGPKQWWSLLKVSKTLSRGQPVWGYLARPCFSSLELRTLATSHDMSY